MKDVIEHFKKVDPLLAPLVVAAFDGQKPIALHPPTEPSLYFRALAEMIIGQQLSVKAADTIWARFVELLNDKVTPETVYGSSLDELRSVGISRQKAGYLRAISSDLLDQKIRLDNLDELDDRHVIAELVKLKGVGPWTAEMFLMFTLGRPDVFSFSDLGLVQALADLYGDKTKDKAQLEHIVKGWSPYRTYAALALWHGRDNMPK